MCVYSVKHLVIKCEKAREREVPKVTAWFVSPKSEVMKSEIQLAILSLINDTG